MNRSMQEREKAFIRRANYGSFQLRYISLFTFPTIAFFQQLKQRNIQSSQAKAMT